MGFIPNKVIVIDACLTKLGREKLANGTFNVTKFAIYDDEVDYSLYDPTDTGNEGLKIKQQPIFESTTLQNDLKYHCYTLSVPNIVYLPYLNSDFTVINLDELDQRDTAIKVTYSPTIAGGGSRQIPNELIDSFYEVYVPSQFLILDGLNAISTSDTKIAYYLVESNTTTNSYGGKNLEVSVKVASISDNLWTAYGKGTTGSRTITTMLEVVGRTSGVRKQINCIITENVEA